jgi:hypothetical protein
MEVASSRDLKRHRTTHPNRPPSRAAPHTSGQPRKSEGRPLSDRNATRADAIMGKNLKRGARWRKACIGPVVTGLPVVLRVADWFGAREAVAGENVRTAQRELTPSIDAKGCASEAATPATAAQANKAAKASREHDQTRMAPRQTLDRSSRKRLDDRLQRTRKPLKRQSRRTFDLSSTS